MAASGAIFIPPAAYGPFIATISNIWPRRVSPPTTASALALFQRANTLTVETMNATFPPSAFEDAFASRAIAPLMPAPAKLANQASPLWNVARPASIVRTRPFSATRTASSNFSGRPRLRAKSVPVPRERTAISTSPPPAASRPFTTS